METLELRNIIEKLLHDGNGRNQIAEIITHIDAGYYPEILQKITTNLAKSEFSTAIIPALPLSLPDEHGRLRIGKTSSLEKDSNVATLVENALGLESNSITDFKRYYHVTTGGFDIEMGHEFDEHMHYTKMLDVYIHIDNAEKLLNTLTSGMLNYSAISQLAKETRRLMSRFGSEFLALDIKQKERLAKGDINVKEKSCFAMAILSCNEIDTSIITAHNHDTTCLSDEELKTWIAIRDELAHYHTAWQSHRIGTYADTKFDVEVKRRINGYINIAGKQATSDVMAELKQRG